MIYNLEITIDRGLGYFGGLIPIEEIIEKFPDFVGKLTGGPSTITIKVEEIIEVERKELNTQTHS